MRRWETFRDERRSLGREPPEAALLPAEDEAAGRLVVADRGARRCERDPPPRALAAALDRPYSGRAAARAERRFEPRQGLAARRAQLLSSRCADDAALRQEKIEHSSTLGAEVCRKVRASVETVRRAPGQARPAAK